MASEELKGTVPLWPLPLAIAVVMVVAAHVAWRLSVAGGHVPECIPYFEGCTSISRAARHGLGNHVFRLLMLPCALLQGLHWWTTRRWVRLQGAPPGAGAILLPLGIVAACALAVYATFLGTEGDIYRFLRRYGVTVYFACTYLCQLVFLRQAAHGGLVAPRLARAMVVVAAGMLLLGIGNVAAAALTTDPDLKDRLENVTEWQLGALLVAWFLLQAWAWRRSGYRLHFSVTGRR